jgi:hypothetical protein
MTMGVCCSMEAMNVNRLAVSGYYMYVLLWIFWKSKGVVTLTSLLLSVLGLFNQQSHCPFPCFSPRSYQHTSDQLPTPFF